MSGNDRDQGIFGAWERAGLQKNRGGIQRASDKNGQATTCPEHEPDG